MHRKPSHAILMHRRFFGTPHQRCAASQHVAGPLAAECSGCGRCGPNGAVRFYDGNRPSGLTVHSGARPERPLSAPDLWYQV